MAMGETTIHEDVFREIASLVLEEIEGIYCYEPKSPLAPLLGDKSIKPQITIRWPALEEENQEQVSYEIKIAALYGASIPKMVSAIREGIAERVKGFTGYDVPVVDVYITKLIRFEQERSLDNEPQSSRNNQDEGHRELGHGEQAGDSD